MAKRRGLMGRLFDTRVDKWMSWDYLSETTSRIKTTITSLARPEQAKFHESFEEAMIRLGLTEMDLQKRQTEFMRLFILFVIIGLGIIGYAVYMAYKGYFGACLISFCLAGFSFAQAFKWHFWLFQIRHRKLGCTIQEWLNGEIKASHKAKNLPSENVDTSSDKGD